MPISIRSPNTNAVTERAIKSIRNECLDYFIILTQKQLKWILKKYIEYYNQHRPHQGIEQRIPKGFGTSNKGKIIPKPVLNGLIHTFERIAA